MSGFFFVLSPIYIYMSAIKHQIAYFYRGHRSSSPMKSCIISLVLLSEFKLITSLYVSMGTSTEHPYSFG